MTSRTLARIGATVRRCRAPGATIGPQFPRISIPGAALPETAAARGHRGHGNKGWKTCGTATRPVADPEIASRRNSVGIPLGELEHRRQAGAGLCLHVILRESFLFQTPRN